MAHYVRKVPQSMAPLPLDPDQPIFSARTRGHHRRPRALMGSNDPRNLSPVPPDIEEAWHGAFRTLCATRIAFTLDESQLVAPARARADPTHREVNIEPIPKMRCKLHCPKTAMTKRQRESWGRLMRLIAAHEEREPSIQGTIAYINAHLIDPDYRLVVYEDTD